jgi:hypothetical protein
MSEMGTDLKFDTKVHLDRIIVKCNDDELLAVRRHVNDAVKERTARRVTPAMRRKYGRFAATVKVRDCKGCGHPFSAREMRTHSCTVAWPDR